MTQQLSADDFVRDALLLTGAGGWEKISHSALLIGYEASLSKHKANMMSLRGIPGRSKDFVPVSPMNFTFGMFIDYLRKNKYTKLIAPSVERLLDKARDHIDWNSV